MGICTASYSAFNGSKAYFQPCGMAHDRLCDQSGRDRNMDQEGLLFVDVKETGGAYPIPAAFAAYAEYLNISLGQEKYKEGK